jgi:iron(III) transport system ATP-binding protein
MAAEVDGHLHQQRQLIDLRQLLNQQQKQDKEPNMSVNIKIVDALKKYGDNTIISDLSLDVREGEFFTLLGPSGCGKTTLLRMIAGFNSIEGGDFFFNDVRINDMDPAKRNIGMVFQNYAIFPNMTVEKNVAFGLKNRKLPKEKIQEQTDKFLKLMQIDEYRDRMPERLSGGQQQRVALARALAITPDVLLMDEPLSNLDAKLRVEMRSVIKEIQHSVGITTIYVTHDQEEAMAVSDRIAVMNHGDIQQVGSPKDLYQRPANLFVANFIGRTNIMKGKLKNRDGKAVLILKSGHEAVMDTIRPEEISDRDVNVSIRPEEMVVSTDAETGIHATIDDSVFLGLNTTYFVHFEDGEKAIIIQESKIGSILPKGTDVKLNLKTEKLNIFDESGDHSLMTGVVNDLDQYRKKADAV